MPKLHRYRLKIVDAQSVREGYNFIPANTSVTAGDIIGVFCQSAELGTRQVRAGGSTDIKMKHNSLHVGTEITYNEKTPQHEQVNIFLRAVVQTPANVQATFVNGKVGANEVKAEVHVEGSANVSDQRTVIIQEPITDLAITCDGLSGSCVVATRTDVQLKAKTTGGEWYSSSEDAVLHPFLWTDSETHA